MIGIIIQARMLSKRLPGKVLKKILGKPMIELIIQRLKKCKEVDEIIVATSKDNSNQKNFLPQSSSDFIYAIIIEEYGFIVGVSILILYLRIMKNI